jgi:hypothetical protein
MTEHLKAWLVFLFWGLVAFGNGIQAWQYGRKAMDGGEP